QGFTSLTGFVGETLYTSFLIFMYPTVYTYITHACYLAYFFGSTSLGLQQDNMATVTKTMALACFEPQLQRPVLRGAE
ncbi:hypothetical protein EZS27_024877, partial [termite gut metagenome]